MHSPSQKLLRFSGGLGRAGFARHPIGGPVAMLKSIRILLANAAFYDYEIWKMDVKTAFLDGNLSEDVYMIQLEGFVNPKNAKKICKLWKSIYGLKQASRSWNLSLQKTI